MASEPIRATGHVEAEPPGLLRQLGVVSAAALVVSNMVGTGIFTALGFQAGELGSPRVILLIWVVGALCALAGAFCYSELGVNFPASGGEYVYLTRAFGPTWGFMSGWVSFFGGFSAPIAAAALAFSDYLGFFHPGLRQANPLLTLGSGDWTVRLGGAQMAACALIGTFTVLNCFGVGRVARIQNVLTACKLAVVLLFILLGIAVGNGDWGHFSQEAVRTSDRPLAIQFAVSLFFVYASYSGWNAATYIAEELRNPARTLPLALAVGTGLVAVLYLGLNIVFLYGVPLEDAKGVLAIGSFAANRLFGPQVAGVFSLLMAVSLMSTVNAMVTIGPRVYYAMARNRAFLPAAGRLHPAWRTPVAAIVAQGLCAMVMTAVPFGQLVFYIGFLLNFFTTMAVVALLFFRRRPDWQRLPVVSFAYPLVPAFYAVVGLWITYMGMTFNFRVSFLALLTVVAGALAYRLLLQPSAPSPGPRA